MTEAGYYSLITSFTGRKAEVARARLAHEFIRQREFIKKVISEPEIEPEIEPEMEIVDDSDLQTDLQKAMLTLAELQADSKKQIAHQKSRLDRHDFEICDVKNKIKIIKESLTKSRQFNFLNDIKTFNIAFPVPYTLQRAQVSD